MLEFEDSRKMVIGMMLTNLFFTKQDGPHDYMPGILPAYYFSTIMELDHHKKIRFENDFIVEWNDDEPIITLTNENWNLHPEVVFKNQIIVDLLKDNEGQWSFLLENGTTIKHTIYYGDQLFIEPPF